jgi:diguanylate cyclase (GGDEF)-like protein
MQEILIKSIMTTQVQCASPSTPFSHVIQSMKQNRHSCMVITEDDRPVGMLTERDIVHHVTELVGKGKTHDPAVGSVMSAPPVTIDENATLFEALVVSKSNRIRHLPVTDGQGHLVGVVTYTDLVAAHFQVIDKYTEILEHEVATRTEQLLEANKKLRDLSLEDGLLRIGNRRSMEVDLHHTHSSATRYQRPYAVVLFDVDYFKLYNDHYGHPAGDRVLQQVSGFLKEAVRKSDRVYRYGGEEILVLLPETSRDDAHAVARRLVEGIANCRIPHALHPLKVLTVSGGVSSPHDKVAEEPWHDVVQRADWALYQAKHQGRNRIEVFFSDLPTSWGQSSSPIAPIGWTSS